ncbi:hypothetical protein [Yersinia intermedia]|uniref:hypothetical protein n=1 Tax=Yersinia intermedia TaxID=631 RepID=UPI001F536474|nr:hypothetical protein [Yersinia intermedia]UNK25146.1 hypothetical protein MNQ97_09355 [Yersinia intermedia]
MLLPRNQELALANFLKSKPYNAVESQIQYGIKFTLESGVICNFQGNQSHPQHFTFYIQNHAANFDQANIIEHFASGLAMG